MNSNLVSSLVQRFGTAVWDEYNVIRWWWYDTVRLPAAGTNQLQFFRVPAGGQDPNNSGVGKTTEQTNIPKSASFAQNYFALSAIRTQVDLVPKNRQTSAIASSSRAVNRGYSGINAGVMPTLYNFLNQGTLEVTFGDKKYLTLDQPFVNCPPGGGVQISRIGGSYPSTDASTGPNKYTNFWTQQDPDPNNIWTASPILVIEPDQIIDTNITFYGANSPAFTNTFLVDDTPTYATPSIDVQLIFDGWLIRPRQ